MSDLRSKVAYLQGLSNGMNVDADTKEGKLLNGIISVLEDIADSFTEMESAQEQLEEYVETLDEDLLALENDVLGEEMDDYEEYVEVDCPRCGETVLFDPEIIEDDDIVEVTCPNCDEVVFVNDDDFEAADEPESLDGITMTSSTVEDDI